MALTGFADGNVKDHRAFLIRAGEMKGVMTHSGRPYLIPSS
jgi:hypothetical protein